MPPNNRNGGDKEGKKKKGKPGGVGDDDGRGDRNSQGGCRPGGGPAVVGGLSRLWALR